MEFSTRRQQTPGPDLEINCPKCGTSNSPAISFEFRDRLILYYVIPLFAVTNTFVKCTACGATLRSQLSIHELRTHSSSDISQFLSYEISIVIKLLAILSLLLFIAPGMGLVLAIITVILSAKSGGWPRTVGIVALFLSGLVTIALIVLMVVGE